MSKLWQGLLVSGSEAGTPLLVAANHLAAVRALEDEEAAKVDAEVSTSAGEVEAEEDQGKEEEEEDDEGKEEQEQDDEGEQEDEEFHAQREEAERSNQEREQLLALL